MTLKYLSEKICVAITNYGFSNNSEYLKESFSKYYHTILIDADSPNPPKNTDLSIKNTYYPGLWNAAVEYSVSHGYEWLMFVASDLQIDDIKLLCDLTNQATSNKDIGVYSPSLTADSRTAFGNLYNKSTSSIREAGVIEGFFFLARVEILRDIYPIPETNKSGWGVDVMTCYFSHKSNYLTVVDDRIKIYHPPSLAQHAINSSNGNQDALLYLGNEIVGWANSTHSTLSNNIKLLPTNSSLDLGCGTRIANPFNAASTFGIDIRESDNPNIRAADLNVEAIPFPDNYFDFVTGLDFIEHIPRIVYCPHRRFSFVELMNEVYRVLRPGGFFFASTPAYPDSQAFQDPTHVNIITENTFEYYFCNPRLWAQMYGFYGNFSLVSQEWAEGKLQTLIRCMK